MTITDKRIKDITPYEHNPRNNDNAVEAVAESIKEFGFKVPIVIDRDGVIVAGHTRYKAAKLLDLQTVPCIIADDLTPEQVKAFRLADNKVSELADWNFDLLASELADINDIDMSVFGFDTEETEDPDDVIEDEPPEPPEKPKSKLGDIYQLGRHRLMCGDSTDTKALDKLMNGDKAVFVFTDPPYGVAIGDKNKRLNEVSKGGRIQENIKGDTQNAAPLYEMIGGALSLMRDNCTDDCSYYISSPQGAELFAMMDAMQKAGLPLRHMLIWVKNNASISLGLDYCYRHEPILYTWTEKHNFFGGWSNSVIDDTTPIDKMSKAELKDLVRALTQDKDDSVIYCDKPLVNDLHPTMKPVKLIARFMINSSQKGDRVLDIFGGSGSTLMAAEQLGRTCYTMELDPRYVDVIIKRYEDFTGDKAVKVNEL